MNPIRRLLRAIAKRTPAGREAARWLPTLAGCCSCGTGGPYYEGKAPQVTRYLYVGATDCGNEPDWSSCSEHPLDGLVPVVDYGQDVEVTFRQTEADAKAALAGAR